MIPRVVLYFFTVIILATASSVSAAPPTTPAERRDYNLSLELDDSPSDAVDRFESDLKSSQNAFSVNLSEDNPCDESSGTCNTIYYQLRSNAIEVPWAAMVPPVNKNVTDHLWDPRVVNMTQDNINSIMFLERLTIGLTEPSVANAINASMLESEVHTLNNYTANIHLSKLTEDFPALTMFKKAYVHCLNKYIVEDDLSFSEAQAICTRDPTDASPNPTPTPKGILGYHPAHDSTYIDSEYTQGKVLFLTDFLFNREADQSNFPSDVIIKFRNAFRYFYGDIKYYIDKNSNPSSSYVGMKANYEILEPNANPVDGKREWLDGLSAPTYGIPISLYYNDSIHNIYRHLVTMIFEYCKYYNVGGGANNAFDNFHDYSKNITTAYHEYTPTGFSSSNIPITGTEGYKKLSMPGFIWTAALSNIMFSFLQDYKRDNGSFDCSEFDQSVNFIGYPALDRVPTPLQNYISQVVKPAHDDQVPYLHQAVYFFARQLALGRVLYEAKEMRDVIEKLSSSVGSTVPQSAVNQGFQLISKAIGIGVYDIESALQEVVANLNGFAQNEFIKLQEKLMKTRDVN